MTDDTDDTRVRPPPETVRYARMRVSVIKGPDAGLVVESAGTILRVGTAGNAEVRLTDDTVSRRHCEIELTERSFRVRDNESTNGLRAGGLRVYDVASAGALELSVGDTTLSITPLGESEDRQRATVPNFGELLGESRRMRELFAELERIAPTNMTVLIEGETGTGKEVVARAIHAQSPRAGRELMVFDGGRGKSSVIESQLFGHERGAFTGADSAKAGIFEEGHGSTVFLDEIGEIPLDVQPSLLRVLQERQFYRMGSTKAKKVDVRIIAATNRSLKAEIKAGNFRQDLYYRLEVCRVVVPPLRERLEDIPMLVRHFLALDAPEVSPDEVLPDLLRIFGSHRWPGNVRELRNTVQRLAVGLSVAPELFADEAGEEPEGDEPPEATGVEPLKAARRAANHAFERAYLRNVLQLSQWNIALAARRAKISRQMMTRLVRKHDLRPERA